MAILAHDIDLSSLMQQVVEMHEDGYRFLTITVDELDEDTIELIYHFDKDLRLRNLRLIAPKAEKIPSISPIYPAAFLAENEAEDLFKIHFDGLKIDYKSTLYYDGYDDEHALKMPYCRISTTSSLDGAPKANPSPTKENTSTKEHEKEGR